MSTTDRLFDDWVMQMSVVWALMAWVMFFLGAEQVPLPAVLVATVIGAGFGLHRYRQIRRMVRADLAVDAVVTRRIGSPRRSATVWVRYEIDGERIDARLTLTGYDVGQQIRMLVDPVNHSRCLPYYPSMRMSGN